MLLRRWHAWKAQTAGDARHDGRDEVVEIAKGRSCELEGTEADVVQGLIVEDLCSINYTVGSQSGNIGSIWWSQPLVSGHAYL